MKYFKIFLIFYIQIKYFSLTASGIIQNYYTEVNRAELFISELKYKKAEKIYFKLSKKTQLQSIECHNALVCSSKINNIDKFIYYSKILICYGVPRNYFKQQKFKKLIDSEKWKKRFENQSMDIIFDSFYRKKIEELFKLDQLSRSYNNVDSIKKYDYIIADSITSYVMKYGYPTEKKIGIWLANDSTIKVNNPFDIILLHQLKYQSKINIEFVKKHIKSGDIRPVKISLFNGWLETREEELKLSCCNWGQLIFAQINNQIYICSNLVDKKISDNRHLFYLEPLSDLKKKIEFHYLIEKSFIFGIANSVVLIKRNDPSEEILKYTKMGMTLYRTLSSNEKFIEL